jgi:uncharacterized small protein (DUF1192 family)
MLSLEERVALLEEEVARLKALSKSPDVVEPRWWEEMAARVGIMPDSTELLRADRER